MSTLTRRHFMITAAALPLVTACSNGINSGGASRIDARVDAALNFMNTEVPGARELAQSARGMLVMPLITEAGFGFGASYGRGALRINGVTVDYYSATAGTFGLQIGAQQYAHTIFFMTEAALQDFRTASGWAVGGDVSYTINDRGATMGVNTTTLTEPVIAIVYGQAGLIVGATLEGTRYARILP